MKRFVFAAYCLLFCALPCFSQRDTSQFQGVPDSMMGYRQVSLAILTGYNYYGRTGGELGVTKKFVGGYIDAISGGTVASLEVFRNNNWFIGPKIGVWMAGGVGFGFNFIYYTNFHESSLQFRPTFGGGYDMFFFFYGRNMRITNTYFNAVSKNMIGFNFFFDVKKYPRVNFERPKHFYYR